MTTNKFTIQFDGGNGCNDPQKGYGIGYGSIRINGGPIVRVDHKVPMSNNAAEVATALEAIDFLLESFSPETLDLHFQTDSQTAIKWIMASRHARAPKISKGSSELFQVLCGKIMATLFRVKTVTAEWLPRVKIVAIFGH